MAHNLLEDMKEMERREWRKKFWLWVQRGLLAAIVIFLVYLMAAGCAGPSQADADASHKETTNAVAAYNKAAAMPAGPERDAAMEIVLKRLADAAETNQRLQAEAKAAMDRATMAEGAAAVSGTTTGGTLVGLGLTAALAGLGWYMRNRAVNVAHGLAQDSEYIKEHVPDDIYEQVMATVRARQKLRGHQSAVARIVHKIPAEVTADAVAAGEMALQSIRDSE